MNHPLTDRLDAVLIDRALAAARLIEQSFEWHLGRDPRRFALRGAAERALVVAAAETWFGEPRVRFAAIMDRAGRMLATTDAAALGQAERFAPLRGRSTEMPMDATPFEVIALDRRAAERWIIRVPIVCSGERIAELWLGAGSAIGSMPARTPELALV